jgi:hypothetical protein
MSSSRPTVCVVHYDATRSYPAIGLNLDDAAAAVGCSRKNLERLIEDKVLPSYRLPGGAGGRGRIVVKPTDLEALLQPRSESAEPIAETPKRGKAVRS